MAQKWILSCRLAYIALAFVLLFGMVQGIQTCGKGHFVKEKKCEPCPPNTFMDATNHSDTRCIPCKTKDEHIAGEKLVQNCTSISDAVYECEEKYYSGWDRQCQPCSVCKHLGKFEKRPCSEKKNTVCCDKPDMILINDTCVSVTNSSTDPPMPAVNITSSFSNLTTVTPTSNANATEPSRPDSSALTGGEIAMIVLVSLGLVIGIGLVVALVMKPRWRGRVVRLVRSRLKCFKIKNAEAANGENVDPPREERDLMLRDAEVEM